MPSLCHCGEPLHYSDTSVKAWIDKLIADKGEFVTVAGPDGRRWRVQRHYIALHGLKAEDLAALGFDQVEEPDADEAAERR